MTRREDRAPKEGRRSDTGGEYALVWCCRPVNMRVLGTRRVHMYLGLEVWVLLETLWKIKNMIYTPSVANMCRIDAVHTMYLLEHMMLSIPPRNFGIPGVPGSVWFRRGCGRFPFEVFVHPCVARKVSGLKLILTRRPSDTAMEEEESTGSNSRSEAI